MHMLKVGQMEIKRPLSAICMECISLKGVVEGGKDTQELQKEAIGWQVKLGQMEVQPIIMTSLEITGL